MKTSFSKLYKAGGLNRIYKELENYLFDLINNVETRKRVINDYSDEIFDYMPSYKTTVAAPLRYLDQSDFDLTEFSFVDIGCGKGKALIIANKFKFKEVIGYEINRQVYDVLCKNINKLNIRNSQLINDSINADKIRNKSIIYFYNPFSENMTYDFFKKISLDKNLKQLIIIYVNPQYTKVLNQYKWNIVYEKKVSTQNINIWIKNDE